MVTASFPPPALPPPNYPGDDDSHAPHTVLLGIVVALCAAACVGFSMPVQRWGLTYPKPKVPFLCCKLPRQGVWFVGLCGYGVANGLQAFSLTLGPLFLMSAVFTLLLVFNLVFARWLLHERINRGKIAGALIILFGVVICVVVTPEDAQTTFSAVDVENLLRRPQGFVVVATMFSGLISTALAIIYFECRYPAEDVLRQLRQEDVSTPESLTAMAASLRLAPKRLDRLMRVVYPLSLGLNEGVCQLTLRAWLVILGDCVDHASPTGAESCKHWMLPMFATIWVVCSLLCVPYMIVVFRRYETTVALPIEYGTLNLVAVTSGLLFYNEAEQMRTWQLVTLGVGVSAGRESAGRGVPPRALRPLSSSPGLPLDRTPSCAARQMGIIMTLLIVYVSLPALVPDMTEEDDADELNALPRRYVHSRMTSISSPPPPVASGGSNAACTPVCACARRALGFEYRARACA